MGQTSEYDIKSRKVIWKIKKFPGLCFCLCLCMCAMMCCMCRAFIGGTEQALRVKITFKEQQTSAVRKIIGPISMNFEIPMYNVSNLQVR